MQADESSRTGNAVSSTQPQLIRALGLWQTSAIVVGIMIGTAIFIVPAEITRAVGSPRAALMVWVVAGALSLLGALSFAELAAMMPLAGGQYVYLREAYGSLVSFLCGWAFFLAAQTGGIAVLAVGFAEFLNEFFTMSLWEQRAAAAASIVLFTAINYRGVREGGTVQSILTGLKVAAVVGLILLGYVLVHGAPAAKTTLPAPSGAGLLAPFGVAMVGALWAYEGWNACTFASGEVKNPERNLPLALIFGTLAVIVLYLGLNLVYYHVLDPNEIAGSSRVGSDAAVRIFGRTGSYLVTVLIIISTLGSLNGSILAAPRVYYAMAKDGLFFKWCAAVHPRYHTPHLALLIQCVWAVLMVAMGTYEQLYTYVIYAAWVFYALTAYAVVILRRKQPDVPRPYRVFGYPWVPVIFVLASAWLIANTLMEKPAEAGIGTLIVAAGIPVYFLWKRK
ncbi:MAG TPA: amino acid permease [Terriglobia bacterium]|nr:amino acid permease [Terriglobia bacterium]